MAEKSISQSIIDAQKASVAANIKRRDQALAIYDEIINRYQPGGTFGKAALGQLETQKIQDVGQEMQQGISSGLFGTSTMGSIGRRWEESVGAPARLKLEDLQMQRLSSAQLSKAGFIESIQDIGPDMGLISQLSSQAATMPQERTFNRTYGPTHGSSLDSGFGAYGTLGQAIPSRTGGTGGSIKGTGPIRGVGNVVSQTDTTPTTIQDAQAATTTAQPRPLPTVTAGEIKAATTNPLTQQQLVAGARSLQEKWDAFYNSPDQKGKWQKLPTGQWIRKY